MDKLAPKSAENTISVEKSNISDSSIITPEENGVSVPVLAIKTEENEEKLDISSNFIAEPLPDSVSVISIPSTSQSPDGHQADSKIVLIGTAHVSEKSVEEVRTVIRNLKPDVVAVELCKGRFDSLEGNAQEAQVPIKDLLSGGKIYYYLIHWLLAHLQKKIGEDMGVRTGAEMLSAIDEAGDIGANIALIDRDIQVTLQRFWGKMKFLEKVKMISSLLGGLIDLGKEDDSNLDINHITEPDFVAELVSELRGFAPTAAKVLIDERDAYLAGSIIEAAEGGNKTVVVVIGAGHKSGVIKYLKNPKIIPPLKTLTEIPKKKYGIAKIISFIFVGIIIAFFLLLLLSGVSLKLFLIAFVCWFLITGALSALGTLLAGGHRNSVLTSFLTAWITTPHAGWFAGLVEAKKLNPKASDIKALFAVENFSDIFKNNIMRVLLVASFANIGSVVGAVLGGYIIMQVTGFDPKDIIFVGLRTLGF
ncbi:TraB/GumN family protein [Methanosarcina sp. UBA5]|uniref:TraB/GumN family protein n=1 Tax=Methanosarcina sp. UBA5 TaxID=1915593 RepID=UPI0025E9D856|nr:TraB/GumN family protein [Methanosarcina sp. UBA5]